MKAEFALAAIQGEKTIAPIEGEDGIPFAGFGSGGIQLEPLFWTIFVFLSSGSSDILVGNRVKV